MQLQHGTHWPRPPAGSAGSAGSAGCEGKGRGAPQRAVPGGRGGAHDAPGRDNSSSCCRYTALGLSVCWWPREGMRAMSRCARSLLFSSAAARTGGVETRTRSVGAGGVRIKPSAALRCRVALPSDNPGSAGQPFQHQGPSHTPLLLTFSGSWERDCLVALSNALCLSIPGRDAAPLPKAKPSVSPICPLPLCHSSRDRAPCWPAPPDSTSTPVGTLAGRERERWRDSVHVCLSCQSHGVARGQSAAPRRAVWRFVRRWPRAQDPHQDVVCPFPRFWRAWTDLRVSNSRAACSADGLRDRVTPSFSSFLSPYISAPPIQPYAQPRAAERPSNSAPRSPRE